MSWTEEQVETAIEHWNKGWSVGKIGSLIGKSRNAVTGKLNRLATVGDGRIQRQLRCMVTGVTDPYSAFTDAEMLEALSANDAGTLERWCRDNRRDFRAVRKLVNRINHETDESELA